MIIGPKPSFVWSDVFSDTDNVGQLIEEMSEAKDEWGDPIYDYYTIAHWVLIFVGENANAD